MSNINFNGSFVFNSLENNTTTFNPLNGVAGGQPPYEVVINQNPLHGTVVLNPNNTITYTPNPNYVGSDTFDYVVMDSNGSSYQVPATINMLDDISAQNATAITVENKSIVIPVLTHDTGDNLTVTSTSAPAHGGVVINSDNTVTYVPAVGFVGSDSFNYTITDSHGQTSTAVATVTVTDNIAAHAATATLIENTPMTIPVLINDKGDGLAVTSTSAAAHGTVVINPDNTVTYTPAAGFVGADTFNYTITDSHGVSATTAVTINVTNNIAAPGDTASTFENKPIVISVLENDTGNSLSIVNVADAAHGTVVINSDNTVTYTPIAGFIGIDSFTYTTIDSNNQSATETVVVNIADNLSVQGDNATTVENTPVVISVLANDTGDNLQVTGLPSQPAHGNVVINPDNTVTYTPVSGYIGDDTFSYLTTDSHGFVATAQVSVTVTDNIAAHADNATTVENTAVVIPVLANDTGDNLQVIDFPTQPAHGNVVINPDSTVTYTPDPGYVGPDSFTYTILDFHGQTPNGTATPGETSNATVTINVTGNIAAQTDSATTVEGTSVVIPVLANDTGDNLQVANFPVQPAHGNVVINADNTVTYTPVASYVGADSFIYTTRDSHGQTSNATVTVNVTDNIAAHTDSATTAENTAVTIPVLANDTGDNLQVANFPVQPAHGNVVINADNTVTYTPVAGYVGSDSFIYTTRDSHGQTSNATVTVNVTDNIAAHTDSTTTVENTAVIIPVLANDTGDNLQVSAFPSQPAHGNVVINPDNTVTYTPIAGYVGSDTFTYTTMDSHGQTSNATVTINVTDNITAHTDSATTAENTAVTIPVLANDTGDNLQVSAFPSQPAHGNVVINPDNTVTYTPIAGYVGSDTFTYTTMDSHGQTSNATVTINVTDNITAHTDSATTVENTAVTIPVLANDTGDNLQVANFSVQPTHGTVVINADNTVTYTPVAGYVGPDSFIYTTRDSHGQTSNATVTVNVTDNIAAHGDSAATVENTAVTIPVLANDTGDNLHVSVFPVQPAHGNVVINSDNTVTYTPVVGYVGSDSFTYTTMDSHGQTSNATVTINVTDNITAHTDSATTAENTAVTIPVLANDAGDNLHVTSTGTAAHGTLTINANNTVTYTPTAGFVGTDTFNYTVTDSHGQSSTASATVIVTDNIAAHADSITMVENTAMVIPVLANDTGDSLHVTSFPVQPSHGTVVINADNTVTYTPAPGYVGSDSFIYTATDSHGQSSNAAVTVNVTDNISAHADSITTVENTAVVIPVLANDTGDSLRITGTGTAAHGTVTINANNTVTYTPAAGFVGTDTFNYTITDSHGQSSTASATVIVKDNIMAQADTITTNQNIPIVVSVLANDIGDSLKITGTGTAAHGTLTINANNTVTYTPAVGFVGTDSFNYTVTDSHGQTSTAAVTVTVAPVASTIIYGENGGSTIVDSGMGAGVIYGNESSGNNTVTTGLGNDVIYLVGASNTVNLGSGNNVVVTGNGNDTINLGSGNDTIYVGSGNSTITAGTGASAAGTFVFSAINPGTDVIKGFVVGRDQVQLTNVTNPSSAISSVHDNGTNVTITFHQGGQVVIDNIGGHNYNSITSLINAGIVSYSSSQASDSASETISIGSGTGVVYTAAVGNDTIQDTGNGSHTIYVGDGNDSITLGSGNNTLFVGSGNDTITAGSGNNTIIAGDGNDKITVGSGNNMITVGNGVDTITLGNGHDVVNLGSGNNTITAGKGVGSSDMFVFSVINSGNNEVKGFIVGQDQIGLTNVGNLHADISSVKDDGHNVMITFSNGGQVVIDSIGGHSYNSIDSLVSSGIVSYTDSNSHSAIYVDNDCSSFVYGGNGNGVINVPAGSNETVYTGDGNNTINVGNYNDELSIGNGNNTINLGNGNDIISVGSGIDTINLGSGNNTIFLGSGNDTVNVGSGNNLIVGGSGSGATDLLVFSVTASTGNNTIQGFTVGQDQIGLKNVTNIETDIKSVQDNGTNVTINFKHGGQIIVDNIGGHNYNSIDSLINHGIVHTIV